MYWSRRTEGGFIIFVPILRVYSEPKGRLEYINRKGLPLRYYVTYLSLRFIVSRYNSLVLGAFYLSPELSPPLYRFQGHNHSLPTVDGTTLSRVHYAS